MDPTVILLVLAGVFGLYMAWNIGANDVANAMGTSVGSHALTIKQAIVVAAIFEFAGAALVGGHVTDTIRQGITDTSLYEAAPHELAVGMLAALLAAALWLQLASWKGLPVSTTHSIVGGVVGFSIASRGFASVEWGKVGSIVASWFISPLFGGLLAFLTFTVIRRCILDAQDPLARTRRVAPLLIFTVGVVLTLTLFFKGLKNLNLHLSVAQTVGLSLGGGLFMALVAAFFMRGIGRGERLDHVSANRRVERVFAWLQIVTACFMAFAHGSNDVANAVGPVAGVLAVVQTGTVAGKAMVPSWVLAAGGLGIVVGLATWGARVIETVGKKITEITPTRGFSAEFGAAATVLIGSRLGLPLSTTHVLVGAVIGVGFARGIAALNMRVLRDVVSSWVITVPLTGLVAAGLYWLLKLAIL
jgi:inorganic phosphate transporter, PiT family